ncbi:MAG TPA: hypothetical protein VGR73_06400 [Bryobacteraceae bacterium]|nr:hypothetical protein [Bryobacteraceae bacterium]
MVDERKHVLVWVSEEFLHSAGMLRILEETVLIEPGVTEARVAEGAEKAGGCALAGLLVDAQHGAGVWIAPENSPGLELMIPWTFVRGLVTAESPKQAHALGLASLVKQALSPPAS